jgi:hypothetical protein
MRIIRFHSSSFRLFSGTADAESYLWFRRAPNSRLFGTSPSITEIPYSWGQSSGHFRGSISEFRKAECFQWPTLNRFQSVKMSCTCSC